jgi:hypothetical protein
MSRLVVFTHLPWGSVYQRLQQLSSRLAKRFLLLFVEACACDKPRAERETADGALPLLLHPPHLSACAIA